MEQRSEYANQDSTLTIRSRADLRLLGPYHRATGRRIRDIKLVIPSQPPADVEARQSRLKQLMFACGCGEATAFGIIAAVGFVTYLFLHTGIGRWSWMDLARLLLVFFLASGLGKWIGRSRAKQALRREIRDLERFFPEEPPSGPRVPCAVGHR